MKNQANELSEVLRASGHRLTSSRKVILEALAASGGHLSADEMAAAVRRLDGTVSRMTVYRTLELLCELGQVRQVYQGARAARFVLLENGVHHHFICSECGRIVEIDYCQLEDFQQDYLTNLQASAGFSVQSHLLELYGLCEDCQD